MLGQHLLYEIKSINEVCKIFGFFDPLPRCPHLELICTKNSRILPYNVRFSMTPSPSDANIISGCPISIRVKNIHNNPFHVVKDIVGCCPIY